MAGLILNRDQCREVDRRCVEEYGLPSIALMENAGRGTADWLRSLGISGRVLICCGAGNNGGDGLVVARHLDAEGFDVAVMLWVPPEKLKGDAATNYQVLAKSGVGIECPDSPEATSFRERLAAADWVVDGLLGTGARGEPRPPLDRVIEAINGRAGKTLALDVPSGLDCDTGEAAGKTIRASHTATYLANKPGLSQPSAAEYTGEIRVLTIGAPRRLIDEVAKTG